MHRRVLPLKRPDHTLQTAAAVFLDLPDLSPASRRSYSQTLQHLARAIGEQPLATLDTAAVERRPSDRIRRHSERQSRASIRHGYRHVARSAHGGRP